jgi:hypothetical protein
MNWKPVSRTLFTTSAPAGRLTNSNPGAEREHPAGDCQERSGEGEGRVRSGAREAYPFKTKSLAGKSVFSSGLPPRIFCPSECIRSLRTFSSNLAEPIYKTMPEVTADEPKNWLQLYVDAVTEKDPYKRLALVHRLRQVPRHDESDETPERPRLRVVSKPALPKPALPRIRPKAPAPMLPHVMRSRKPKKVSKTPRRRPRLRSA